MPASMAMSTTTYMAMGITSMAMSTTTYIYGYICRYIPSCTAIATKKGMALASAVLMIMVMANNTVMVVIELSHDSDIVIIILP